MYCIVIGSRRLMSPDALQPNAFVQTVVLVVPTPPETLVVKGGTSWARNVR